jgi:hypothetical protein
MSSGCDKQHLATRHSTLETCVPTVPLRPDVIDEQAWARNLSRLASDANKLPGEACDVNDAIEDIAEPKHHRGFPTDAGTEPSRTGNGGEVVRCFSVEKNESERHHSGMAR